MAELINAAPGGFTLNSGFKSIAGRWRRLSGDSRSVLVIALLAAIVAAAIVVMLWTSTRHYVPLYGKQELYDKATIIDTLEKENIDFRLDGSSGNVLVPEDRLADARMRLAAKGVKASLPAGFDELNNMSPSAPASSWSRPVTCTPWKASWPALLLLSTKCVAPGCTWRCPSALSLWAVKSKSPARR